jgi:hypothetical protein
VTVGSVIIPAHDEERVIGRCMDALLSDVAPGALEVLVVCNGCTDRTPQIAAGYAPVRVLRLPEASKLAALRAGDAVASVFPRLYLDADVELRGADAIRVLQELDAGPALAARPPLQYDTSGCSWPVRRYYRARVLVPGLMGRLWGAGVYALSEAGHKRVAAWPDGVADDLFVDSSFADHEIAIVSSGPVVVHPARTARSLAAVLARGIRLKSVASPAFATDTAVSPGLRQGLRDTLRGLLDLLRERPTQGIDVAVYAGIATWSRVTARTRATAGWTRDESSRATPERPGSAFGGVTGSG